VKIFDLIKVKKTGALGKIILILGLPAREVYADMYPGAEPGYEYLTMWDEEEGSVVVALNRYSIDEVEVIPESEINNRKVNNVKTKQ